MIKRLAALAITSFIPLTLATVSVYAQDDAAKGPVGDWDIAVQMTPEQSVNATLSVTENADGSLMAKVASPVMGEAEVQEISMEGDKISFTQVFGEGDSAMEVSFSGIFEGDTFTGTLVSPMGEMPVKGSRAKPAPAIRGRWDVTSDSQLGVLERTLVVNKDWTGAYIAKDSGDEFAISNLAVDGSEVSFDVTVSAQGQDLPLTFKGTHEGDSLTGEFFMDGNSVSQVTGKKAPGGIAVLAGSWELSLDTPLGVLENRLVVNKDGTGTYISEQEVAVEDLEVDGDFVAFRTTVHAQGQPYEVSLEGSVAPDSFKGDILLGGNPVGTFEGKPAGAEAASESDQ